MVNVLGFGIGVRHTGRIEPSTATIRWLDPSKAVVVKRDGFGRRKSRRPSQSGRASCPCSNRGNQMLNAGSRSEDTRGSYLRLRGGFRGHTGTLAQPS